ncbi:hypothetical protein GCM10022215_18140 [Nocardioides fonticola]|uniref:ATP-binding protein n=1 Tax=Nocardioides fonticola TaxID=450363 RepID=A0ABP7XHQ4_9ACTN
MTRSRIVVVTGPPCAGKSTHVRRHATPDDVVVDLDELARALGHPESHVDPLAPPTPAADLARSLRADLIRRATAGALARRGTVWIVDARPSPTSLAIYRRVGAVVVALDAPPAELRRRAVEAGRPEWTLDRIAAWDQPTPPAASVFR